MVAAGDDPLLRAAVFLDGVPIIENFIAGIVIFWDKPFKIGDHVEIGQHGR